MNIKIKRLDPMAQIPSYAKEGDAGLDLTAISKEITNNYVEYKTGLAVQIPEGYVGLIFPRSSISKHDLQLCNSVGVIDSGYRGEIICRFNVVQNDPVKPFMFEGMFPSPKRESFIYEVGEKVAQLMIIPYPKIVLEVVDELEESDRGEGGFGSTGK